MKRIIFFVLILKVIFFLWYLLSRSKENENAKTDLNDHDINYDDLTNKSTVIINLEGCKSHYPFPKWRRNNIEHGMQQYTQENCEAIELIFDELIADLKMLPSEASAEDKVILFKYAILATNAMNNRIGGFIETQEREDLCELFDYISIAAGLEPEEFAKGEGIASEWREW